MERVPNISPLNGNVNFKLNCHSESQVTTCLPQSSIYICRVQVSNKAFLTMFDDVSGFGAWHRRWVVLEGNTLAFWKYPENEKVQGKTIVTCDVYMIKQFAFRAHRQD